MNFLHPQFLYYMILPLIIFFILIVTQRNKQMSFFSDEVLRRLSVHGKYLSSRTRNIIYFFIFLLLIITLAQPVISDGKVRIQAKSADVVLALDISTSMLAKDVYPDRLKMAQYKMLKFIKLFSEDKIGIIAFAKNTFLVSPLSYDHSAVFYLLKHLQPALATQPGVNFGQLLYSTNRISKSKTNRYLVIFTDGGHQNNFNNEIKYAKRHHIVIFVLGIGQQKGVPIPTQQGFLTHNGHIVITKLNTKISNLATQTGGVYIHSVLSNEDVIRMVQEVSFKAKGQFLKSHTIIHYIPLFYIPLALALLLLLIAMSSISKINKVIPFLMIILFTYAMPSHADIFTAKTLQGANQAYQNHQYTKSSRLFKKYYQQNHNNNVRYDLGNALYKDKKYNQAIKKYETIHFDNKIKKANVLYNLANAYVKKGDIKSLKYALKLYNKSLKLNKNLDAIYNIYVVKKLLREKYHKKQNKKSKQKSSSKQNKKQSKQHKQNNSSKQSEKQSKQHKQNSKQNNNNQKIKNNRINNYKNLQQRKQPQQQRSNLKRKRQKKVLIKNNQKVKYKKAKYQKIMKQNISQSKSNILPKNKISKKEIKQWLKRIEYKTSTHMYQLKQMKTNMKDYHDEPW